MRYAFRNIIRLKTRSVLCLLICFAVLFLSMFGFLIRTICEDARYRFYGPLDGSVHITDEELNPYLTYHVAKAIADDAEGVITGVSAIKEYVAWFSDIEYVGYGTYRRMRYSGEAPTEDGKSNYLKGFDILAVTSMEILEDVYRGDVQILEGSMITDADTEKRSNKIVISKELADVNGLVLGDTVNLNMLSIYQGELPAVRLSLTEDIYDDYDFDYEYVIGGIFKHQIDNTAAVSEPWKLNSNTVYIPITTIEDISKHETVQFFYHDDNYYSITVNPIIIPDALYFHLADTADAELLEKEINEIGFIKTLQLTEYVSDGSSSPSARLSGIISYVLVGIIAVGFVILALSVYFNMKARHRELAVLVALGKKRVSVAWSFFFEIFMLVFLSLVFSSSALATVIFSFAKPLLGYLYSAEVSAQFKSETADFYLFENRENHSISQSMGSTEYLLSEYMIPSILFALMATALLAVILYVVMRVYTSQINPLYDVGAKE